MSNKEVKMNIVKNEKEYGPEQGDPVAELPIFSTSKFYPYVGF